LAKQIESFLSTLSFRERLANFLFSSRWEKRGNSNSERGEMESTAGDIYANGYFTFVRYFYIYIRLFLFSFLAECIKKTAAREEEERIKELFFSSLVLNIHLHVCARRKDEATF